MLFMCKPPNNIRWRWGLVPSLFLLLLSLYPQLRLWQMRGRDWQGNYAYNDIDEVAYAAYLNALADGRPRRNDPYTGYDDTRAESIFSIQFVTPYVFAKLARSLGGGGPLAMMLVAAWAGAATGLALFWLIAALTGDARWGVAGALLVICGGTLAVGQGAIGTLLGGTGPAYPFLPAFRRYIPAGAGPFLWAGTACVWCALAATTGRRQAAWTIAAGLCCAVLVFSYFYLWTTAAAFLVCLAVLWWAVRRDCGRVFLGLGALAALALGPYFYLLAQRGHTTDAVQLLARTHAPDLLRPPEIIGLVSLLLIVAAVWRGRVAWRTPLALFAAAFALTPLLTFNQQILTGHSLQPIHYEVFTGNYIAVLALILGVACLFRQTNILTTGHRPLTAVVCVAALACGWGLYEARHTGAVLDEANLLRDQAMPVMRRLRELGASSPETQQRATVFTGNFLLADELPTVAPQPVLWARHLHIFAGADWDENKERFYQELYWLDLDENWLDAQLHAPNFVIVYALFGWGRLSNRLIATPQPLTEAEIAAEVTDYANYRNHFDRRTAARVPLSYVIIGANEEFDWTRLEQWYQRDAGEMVGDYVLFRVHLRDER